MDRNKRRWTTSDIPPQTGRRALVTGANSGIGFHTVLELARKGAEIIIPARTQAKAEEAIRRIRKEVPAAKLIPDILDLADLGSVRAFAERFLKRFAIASLDLLINNAGGVRVGHAPSNG
jgi:NAD(P)-dependent dehydrogenase (short-subunit alcohol dehydrogenase family)